MGIIDEQLIKRKCALDTTFSRAKKIFDNREFYYLNITKVGGRSVEFSSSVAGKNIDEYNVSIELEKLAGKYILKEYYCECPAYDSYGGFCKHLAAVALEINYSCESDYVDDFLQDNSIGGMEQIDDYSDDYNDDIIASKFENIKKLADYLNVNKGQFKGVTSASGRTFSSNSSKIKKTSSEILDSISNYLSEERSKYSANTAGLKVNLEPAVHFERNKMFVDWKIGRDKMYVVKSVKKLVESVKDKAFVSYGKNLEFVHRRDAFSEDAQKCIDFLLGIKFEKTYNYYSLYNDKRYVSLEGNEVAAFLSLYKGKYITAFMDDNYVEYQLKIEDKDIRLPVNILGKANGKMAEIVFPNVTIIESIGKYFIVYSEILYCCSEQLSDVLKIFLPVFMPSYRGMYNFESIDSGEKILELYEPDYQAFSDTLLPVMKEYMDINIDGVDFSKYIKEKPQYEIYLDIDNKKTVSCQAKVKYGEKEHYLTSDVTGNETYRDLHSEYCMINSLKRYFPDCEDDSDKFILRDNDELLAELVEYGVKELEKSAHVFASETFGKVKITVFPKVSAGISIKGELLNVSWDLDGMSGKELNDILSSFRKKKKYHRLKSGELLVLSGEGIEFLNELQDDFHLTGTQIKSGSVTLQMHYALYLDSLMKQNAANIYVSRDSMFENIINSFDIVKEESFHIPSGVNAELRPYQYDGFKWAKVLSKLGFGGVLADDMGLGKTLQMITYLLSEKTGVSLVVCPASLVYNWESEFNKFAPEMKVCAVVGKVTERKEVIDSYKSYDVLITSYDLLKRDISYYKDIRFNSEIIDEAQYIKNPSTQAAKCVKSIDSKVRFALTGTPIENRLSELWSIFEYLMPGYLFSYKSFKETFEEKIVNTSVGKENAALNRLHKMIAPFILRRLKKDVLKDLPEKIEEVIYAKFENEQEKIYKATEKKVIESLKKTTNESFQENKLQILAELTRLRQICCDPSLIFENYKKESAKLTACLDLIESGISNGHKILLFSQFTTMLDLLNSKLEQRGIKVFLLTGSTTKKKRMELVEQFQNGLADIFLISLKAGGTGLNLTNADIVIHYDPWWNVAAQNQATDRAHRIGQENNVYVVKLIAKNSIEERILKLQEKKRELADKIISGENVSLSSFSKEDLLELFK